MIKDIANGILESVSPPHSEPVWGFVGGVTLVIANAIWVILSLHYREAR